MSEADSSSYNSSLFDKISQEVEQGFKNNVATIVKIDKIQEEFEGNLSDCNNGGSSDDEEEKAPIKSFMAKNIVFKNPRMHQAQDN